MGQGNTEETAAARDDEFLLLERSGHAMTSNGHQEKRTVGRSVD
jgi:hypothetical protein